MRSKKTRLGMAFASLCVLAGALVPGGAGCGELETEDAFVVPLADLAPGEQAVPNEYIFFFRADATEEQITRTEKQIADVGGMKLKDFAPFVKGIFARVPEGGLDGLRRDPAIASIMRNYLLQASGIQSCPPWGLDVIDQMDPRIPNNHYAYESTGKNVHVFVLDSGIDASHPDFQGPNGTRVGNGHCTATANCTPDDCHGHGTHVAGVIGGKKFGVAKDVTLHSVRVASCSSFCEEPVAEAQSIIDGLTFVKQEVLAKSIQNAIVYIGFSTQTVNFWGVYKEMNTLNGKIPVVVPAGNNNGYDSCLTMPGGIAPPPPPDPPDAPKEPPQPRTTITVGAYDGNGNVWSKSNQGACIDLFAPGESIPGPLSSDCSKTSTGLRSGTSVAAAHVAGVAALLLGEGLSADKVKSALIDSARSVSLGSLQAGTTNAVLRAPLLSKGVTSPPLFAPVSVDADDCQDGALCTDGACSICGALPAQCNGVSNGGGLSCDTEGECSFCGAKGLACCRGPTSKFCAPGLSCSAGGICSCGEQGESCCGGKGGFCKEPFECNTLGSCGPCGFPPDPMTSKLSPCCDGQCFGDDVTCNNENNCVLCGKLDQDCCGTECLDDSLTCVNGTCKKCGFPPDPVTMQEYACCDGQCIGSDVTCNNENKCVLCGKLDQACCGTECLNDSLTCVNGTCKTCGLAPANGVTYPCCDGQCLGTNLVCNGSNQCVAAGSCGASGQMCCSNGSCSAGLQCNSGVCESSPPCGALNQACCLGSSCNPGLYCDNNSCEECGGYGETCCPFPATPCGGDMVCGAEKIGDPLECLATCRVRCRTGKLGHPDPNYVITTQFDCLQWADAMCSGESWLSRVFFNEVPIAGIDNCGDNQEACCLGVPECASGSCDTQPFPMPYPTKVVGTTTIGYYTGQAQSPP